MDCSEKTKKIYGLTSNTRNQKKNQTEKKGGKYKYRSRNQQKNTEITENEERPKQVILKYY